MSSGPYSEDLALALQIADAVDAVTMAGFGPNDIPFAHKDDESPVTEIDRDAESTVRDVLERKRPADAVLGEEFGTKGGGPRQWVIDPVDGTKNYMRGIPVWATLIALLDEGKPVMGVVSAPALGMRWFAAKGDGAWKGKGVKDAKQIYVSEIAEVKQATISHASIHAWEKAGRFEEFVDLLGACWRERGFGDFWSYMLVAEGVVEIATEPSLELYDMAALVPIVEEAGGTFTSVDGQPGPFGGNALVTNGLLHDAVIKALAGE